MLKIILIFVFVLSFHRVSFANSKKTAEDLIQKFSASLYYPQDNGVKDLYVEIEIPSITKQLNEQLIFGKLKKVIFKLYWMQPNLVDVSVDGLPEGYYQIKNNLREMVAARLDMVIPKKFEENFKGYDLDIDMPGVESQVSAIDHTNMKITRSYKIKFDKEGVLEKLVADGNGLNRSSFVFSKASASNNKLILKNNKVTILEAGNKTTINNKINYQVIENNIFPVLLNSDIEQLLNSDRGNRRDGEKYSRKFKTVVLFKNYNINRGIAQEWFKKNKPMITP